MTIFFSGFRVDLNIGFQLLIDEKHEMINSHIIHEVTWKSQWKSQYEAN